MFENYLIVHCASTLAGIKTANLFSAPVSSEKNAEERLTLFFKKLMELTSESKRKNDKNAKKYHEFFASCQVI